MAATEEVAARDTERAQWTDTEVELTGTADMRGMGTIDTAMRVTASNLAALEAILSTRWQLAEWVTRTHATRRSTTSVTTA